MAVDIGTLRGLIVLDDRFSPALGVVGAKLTTAGAKFEAIGGKLTSLGSSLTRSVTLPLAVAAGGALKLGADFETSLTKMQTLVGLTATEVEGFEKNILSLAGETARAPKELADAMFFITSAGLRGADALDALKSSAQASALGLGATESVADAVTSAMNAYGPSVLSAQEATNTLALAVRAGKLEATELAPVLGRLLPTASAMGVAFEDVAGVLAVMSRTGLNAAEASTSLSAVMTTLLKPTSAAVDALDGVGLTLADLRDTAKGPGGIVQVMRDLDTAFQGNDEALVQVVPNVRAFRGVMNVLAQDASVVDDVMGTVASGVDVLGSGMAIVSETSGFKFNQFITEAKITLIGLGDELVPAFKGILDAGTKLVQFVAKGIEMFGKLPEPIQTGTIAILALAAAMGPLLTVFGNLFLIGGKVAGLVGPLLKVGGVQTAMSSLAVSVGNVTAAFTAMSLSILGPVAVVAAIAAFSVAIAKAGADAEEAAFKLAEINGVIMGNALAVNDLKIAFQEGGEDGLRVFLDEMDPAIVKSQEFSEQLSDLKNSGRITQEEFLAIADTVRVYRDEMVTVPPVIEEVVAASQTAGTETKKLEEILASLGVTTKRDVVAGLDELSTALESGEVPVKQAAALIDEMWTELKDLEMLTPDVESRLLELARTHDTLKISQTANLASMSELGREFAAMADEFEDDGPIADFGNITLPKMVPELDRAALGMKQFGITLPDIRTDMANLTATVESGQAPVRQMVEAIRGQRDEYEKLGVLTPELNSKLGELERAALENATAADRAALGFKGLFDGLQTGIPAVDGFLGKFGGIFDSITGVLGGLGGKVGGFFSGLTDSIGGLFQQGGQKGGDNFFSGIAGALGGLGGLFGKKGEESGVDFTTQMSAPLTTVPSLFAAAGSGSGTGFGSGIMQTLGGGGGFDIGGIFGEAGTKSAGGFMSTITDGLGSGGTSGGITGLFGGAGVESGGGFLSGLGSIFGGGGGGGGGGGILSSLFGGAGGEAGSGFLSGLMGMIGGGGAGGGLMGIVSAGLNLIPVVGPLLSAFAGPLFKGLKAIGGKVFGFVKGLFGPSADEKEARSIVTGVNDGMIALLGTQQKLEAGGERWKEQNIAQRDIILAMGGSVADVEATWTKFQESTKTTEGAEAFASFFKSKLDAVSAAMETTGLGLSELRNAAINSASQFGISVEDAFAKLAAGTTTFTVDAEGKVHGLTDATAADIVKTTASAAEAIAATTTTATAAVAEAVVASTETVSTAVVASTEVQTAAMEELATNNVAAQAQVALAAEATAAVVQETAITTATVVTGAFESSTSASQEQLLKLKEDASIKFSAIKDDASVKTDEMKATFDTGLVEIEEKFGRLEARGGEAFRGISESAFESARESVRAFEEMEKELVGASVFPDTEVAASRDLMAIGETAKISATAVTGSFQKSGTELEGSFSGFSGGSDSARDVSGGRVDGGGALGDGKPIQLVVDGQVLAEVVLRNSPRALANKGLGRGS